MAKSDTVDRTTNSYFSIISHMSKGAPLLILRKILQIKFGLLTFVILVRILTKEQFAIYTLVFTFIAIFRLSALPGLGMSLSQAFARGNLGGFRKALKLSVAGATIGGLLLGLTALVFWYLGKTELSLALLITALLFPALTGLLFWQHALLGQEKYGGLLAFEGSSYALKCKLIILCASYYPDSLYLVVMAALLVPVVINIIATLSTLKSIPESTQSETGSIDYGIRTTIYQLPTVVANHLDKLILFFYISPEVLAVYAVSLRIPELARGMIFEVNSTLGPIFARKKQYTKVLRTFTFKLWLTYIAVSIFGALFVIPFLLPWLTGPGYPDATFYAQIMTVGVAFGSLGNIQFRYVKSQLDSGTFLSITLAYSVIDVLLVLSLAISFGLPGVVAAYILKRILSSIFVDIIMTRRYLHPQSEAKTVSP